MIRRTHSESFLSQSLKDPDSLQRELTQMRSLQQEGPLAEKLEELGERFERLIADHNKDSSNQGETEGTSTFNQLGTFNENYGIANVNLDPLNTLQVGTNIPIRPISSNVSQIPEYLRNTSQSYLDATRPNVNIDFRMPNFDFSSIQINPNIDIVGQAKNIINDLLSSFDNASLQVPEAFKLETTSSTIKSHISTYMQYPLVRDNQNTKLSSDFNEISAILFEWIKNLNETTYENLNQFLLLNTGENVLIQRNALICLMSLMLLYKIRRALVIARPMKFLSVTLSDITNLTCHVIINTKKYQNYIKTIESYDDIIESVKRAAQLQAEQKAEKTAEKLSKLTTKSDCITKRTIENSTKTYDTKIKEILIVGVQVLGAATVFYISFEVTKFVINRRGITNEIKNNQPIKTSGSNQTVEDLTILETLTLIPKKLAKAVLKTYD